MESPNQSSSTHIYCKFMALVPFKGGVNLPSPTRDVSPIPIAIHETLTPIGSRSYLPQKHTSSVKQTHWCDPVLRSVVLAHVSSNGFWVCATAYLDTIVLNVKQEFLKSLFNMTPMYFSPQQIHKTKKPGRKQHSKQTHGTLVHNLCKKLKLSGETHFVLGKV